MAELGAEFQETTVKKEISALPFTYIRTDSPQEATFRERRVPRFITGPDVKSKTDEEILARVKAQRENQDWFTNEYWREKGRPQEQIDLTVGDKTITVYNWNKDIPFTDEHITRATAVFQKLASKFPQAIDGIRWLLIDDIQQASYFGDPENFPLNGYSLIDWQAFRLLPRAMELTPHRIAKTTNFEGTIAHESMHPIANQFLREWQESFRWGHCQDNTDEWELRTTSDGTGQKWFNKKTGEMSTQGYYPLEPDECINNYAKQTVEEDICDSAVAYLYDQEQLAQVSTKKLALLRAHDTQQQPPEISARRIPNEEIALPEIKPETIYYYIQEPSPSK